MRQYLTTMFEDVTHERSLILLLSLTDIDFSKQPKFSDDELKITKKLALENLQKQRILKEYVASSLLEKQFPNS